MGEGERLINIGGRPFHGRRGTAPFLILIAIMLTAYLATPAHAQPTWSFRVEVLPAKLYMGEWNQLYANITNMDCSMKAYHVLELKSASERYVEAMVARAREMRSRGLIGRLRRPIM